MPRPKKGKNRQLIRIQSIDVLPDEVLLGIFDLYVDTMSLLDRGKPGINAWHSLVHVCRRWRSLVFGYPRRLNLRLFCTPETPAKDTLDVWPPLPLVVSGYMSSTASTDNIIAVLEQSNRICQFILWGLADWQLEKVLGAMQMSFPELTDLQLISYCETAPIIPNSFLDGSAPRLQIFELRGIPFPGLPNLLISATHLVSLWLSDIPHSGYISPETMVALLCALSSLETLYLLFRSPQSCPDWESRNLPTLKPCILPALYEFDFKGVTEYLEEVVARIDTPRLDRMLITFFNQIDFNCPQLVQFINRTPTLRPRDEAHVRFKDYSAFVELSAGTLEIAISCRKSDWQLSSIEQVCNSSFPHSAVEAVEDLYIEHQYSELVWKNDAIENTLWSQLLLPFTAVKDLYLSKEFAPGIAATLQEVVGGGITEVLPSLKNIFVEELEPSFQENIGQFAAVRRHSGHPIAISGWYEPSEFFPRRPPGSNPAAIIIHPPPPPPPISPQQFAQMGNAPPIWAYPQPPPSQPSRSRQSLCEILFGTCASLYKLVQACIRPEVTASQRSLAPIDVRRTAHWQAPSPPHWRSPTPPPTPGQPIIIVIPQPGAPPPAVPWTPSAQRVYDERHDQLVILPPPAQHVYDERHDQLVILPPPA